MLGWQRWIGNVTQHTAVLITPDNTQHTPQSRGLGGASSRYSRWARRGRLGSATDGVGDKQYCWIGIASRANRGGDDGSEGARPG
jgi:hypothetical protein